MAKTFRKQRNEDKTRNKYKRNKKDRFINQVNSTKPTCEQDWNFSRDIDASDY